MKYRHDLEEFDFNQLKSELNERIIDHHTVDQQRVKMTRKLRTVITKMLQEN